MSTSSEITTEKKDSKNPELAVSKGTETPKGIVKDLEFKLLKGTLRYSAEADWMILRKDDEPTAEMFFTAYIAKVDASEKVKRPITFVFNGGPGAASAYLHVGSLGPKRVRFQDNGTLTPPPVELLDNEESWLPFTDLVFIDPIGTGFSRVIKKKEAAKTEGTSTKAAEPDPKEYFAVNRDLESLCEFIQQALTRFGRWTSPVYIAGESYGGFRVAKLTRKLQESYGVGLSGAILISPALEFGALSGNDYDLPMWVDVFPSFVASAWHHRLGRFAKEKVSLDQALAWGEKFATTELSHFMVASGFMSAEEKAKVFQTYSELSGLDLAYVTRKECRVAHVDYTRQLLRHERKVCGLYDSSITLVDPFPDRDTFQGPEPTLFSIDRAFCAGINSLLRDWLGIKTEREYKLLSMQVNTDWKIDEKRHAFDGAVGGTDDLRYGMALNPHMKVFVTHGYFDLITPYFASKRLGSLLKLTDEQKKNLSMEHYAGGHMFYSWKDSRLAFTKTIRNFVGLSS